MSVRPFSGSLSSPSDPGSAGFVITPNDSTELATACTGIYVGVSGDITVKFFGNATAITFKAVPQGSILPVQAQFIMATGTTATNLVGLTSI